MNYLYVPMQQHRLEPRRSRLSRLFSICLLLVGIIIGLVLAFQVLVNWTKLDTPPIYETNDLKGFLND